MSSAQGGRWRQGLVGIVLTLVLFAPGWLFAQETIPATAETPGETLRVGVFDVDASPPIGSVLAYDTTKEVTTPLSCRGVVLVGAGKPIVLCAVDWIGISNGGHRAFRERLATAAETDLERVSVHTLHQHDAPWCDFTIDELQQSVGILNYRLDSPFARRVIDRASEAVRDAITKARSVTHVGLGAGIVEQVASNRRILGPDGKVQHVRYTATRDPVVRAFPEGTIDPQLKLVSFWNGEEAVAVLTYYATHPQSYYRTGKANPDFPGLARNARQAKTGVPHVHFCGAGGNIGAGKYNDGSPENRQVLADRVAAGMERAWEQQRKTAITAADVAWKSVAVSLPPSPHLQEDKLLAALRDTQLGTPARSDAAAGLAWLRRCQAGEKIDIGCLTVGAARVLHLPGELFVEYQLAAQKMRPDRFVAMAAYGDYSPWYIGTEVAYQQGGYETQPTSSLVAPRVERVLLEALRQLLEAPATGPERLGLERSPDVTLTPLFVARSDSYGRYRIPALLVTPRGTVLAFAEGREHAGPLTGNIDLVLRRSVDQGRTWQPQETIVDLGNDTCGNPCAVYEPRTRRIFLAFTKSRSQDREIDIVEGRVPATTVWITSSANEGQTWTRPVEISRTARRDHWGWYGTGPGLGLALRSGRLVIPAYHTEAGVYRSHMLYSDDQGNSWRLGQDVAEHTSECQIVELPDGVLRVNCRTTNDGTHRTVAASRDGGVTWSQVARDENLTEQNCQGCLYRFPRGTRETWLFSHPSAISREDVTVWLSDDGGRTWPAAQRLHRGPSAYSVLNRLPDDSVGFLVECGVNGPYEQIAFGRLSLPQLRESRR